MSGWLEYVEPCEHDVEWHHETSECWAHDGKHKEQPDCYCQGNTRTVLDGFPPGAVEAAAEAIKTVWSNVGTADAEADELAASALAAVWEHLAGETK